MKNQWQNIKKKKIPKKNLPNDLSYKKYLQK